MGTTTQQTMLKYVERQYEGKVKDDDFNLQMQLAREAGARVRMFGILYAHTKLAFEELDQNQESLPKRRTLILALAYGSAIIHHAADCFYVSPFRRDQAFRQ
jgi:hypothetical protein